jgi:hypothetical protein
MQIAVDGPRGSASAQDAVRRIPKEGLPQLTEAQKRVARQLGASEEAYARMILEGERAHDELLVKTEMFARLLQKKLRETGSKAEIENVLLRTLDGKFEVEIDVNGRVVPLRIREDLIDDLFEAGSPDAEERLARILRTTLGLVEPQ